MSTGNCKRKTDTPKHVGFPIDAADPATCTARREELLRQIKLELTESHIIGFIHILLVISNQ